jgi:hypothetical protein
MAGPGQDEDAGTGHHVAGRVHRQPSAIPALGQRLGEKGSAAGFHGVQSGRVLVAHILKHGAAVVNNGG